ncbi:M16 family metallopeptidase [Lysobacter enzymogenes]|uniref:M16 family metallopeptidase n=1 Tax=Lysobacter enzymogenes TaxID=69 RepID=UPI001A972F2E|nr:pitrilysin family protein [Lysobacter enzymogenes]QQP94603.1 insulinase family protein [Lysobacter enzymogenes]
MSAPHRLAVPLALALSLALAGVHAEPVRLPQGASAGPCVEGICEYRLGNGLRVLLFPDASRPTVTLNLVYAVGSAQENYGETGMAHLLEHMLFKGTPTNRDIPAQMKKRGIDYNATTTLDHTDYYASFPADEATLDWVLALEADRMVHSDIAKADLDSEMTVVRNEMESGENSPLRALYERVRSTAYLWHHYGQSTIGARSDVEAVPIERLRGYYRTWYRPDNATLVIAGRIDPQRTLAAVARSFAAVAKPAQPLPAFYTREPAQDGEREVTVRRVGDLRLLMSAYHTPAITHADAAPLAVLDDVLGHIPGGRLHKALVAGGLAESVGVGADALRDPGLFSAQVALAKDGDSAKAQQLLLAQLEGIGAQPVSAAEVDAAKQRIRNAYEQAYTNVSGVAMGLSDPIAAGDWRLYFQFRDALEKVDADAVNRVAKTYLRASNRTLGRFEPSDKPDRVEVPQAPDAASALKGYVGKAAVDAGEQFDPSPANLQARTQTVTIDTGVGRGLKLALLPKKNRGGTVTFSANFRFGDEASLRGREAAGSLAGSMLMRGGAGLSREQIDARFEALKTTARVGGGLQSASIGLHTRREQLADAVALAAQLLRQPAFPETEFEQLRRQAIVGLESQRREPDALAGQALAKHFDPWPAGHPLRARSLDESLAQIKAIKLDELRAFHRDFYGSAEGEIAVVGDFDPETLKRQLQALFAAWKPGHAFAPIATHYTAVAPEQRRLETPDKANGVLIARANVALKETDADYPALVAANYILGGGMKSRLGDRIRRKDGLSYGVGSDLDADSSRDGRDDAGSWSVQAIAAPQNLDKVERAMREELTRLAEGGVAADELRDAVSGLLTQREQARASDATVAVLLSRNLFFDRTMQFSADLDAKFKALTVESVNAAIKRSLKPQDFSVYLAGDFAAGDKPAAAK